MKYTITKEKIYETFYKLKKYSIMDTYTLSEDETRDAAPDKYPEILILNRKEYLELDSKMGDRKFIAIYAYFRDTIDRYNEELEILYKEFLPDFLNEGFDDSELDIQHFYLEKILLKMFKINFSMVNYRTTMNLNKEYSIIRTWSGTAGDICFKIYIELDRNGKFYDEFEDITIDIAKEHIKDGPVLRKLELEEMEGGNQ